MLESFLKKKKIKPLCLMLDSTDLSKFQCKSLRIKTAHVTALLEMQPKPSGKKRIVMIKRAPRNTYMNFPTSGLSRYLSFSKLI